MKKLLLWTFLAILPIFTACDFREVADKLPEEELEQYIIYVDWSDLDEKPTGMTLLFYPSNGGLPIMRLSNNVDRYECMLPPDNYRILVFNQSENEFSYLKFLGLKDFNTAEAYFIEDENPSDRIDRLYGLPDTRAKVSTSAMKPRGLGSAAQIPGSVRAKVNSVSLKGRSNISPTHISVQVRGLVSAARSGAKVVAVNGALTGLATGYFMGTNKLAQESYTQELDDWTIDYADSEDGIGTVSTTIGAFGISPLVKGSAEDTGDDDTQNVLYLNFRLLDGTYVSYRFIVSARVVETIDKEGDITVTVLLEINLGVPMDGVDDGLDEPIILPETGIPYGNIDMNVNSWGDPIDQDITIRPRNN